MRSIRIIIEFRGKIVSVMIINGEKWNLVVPFLTHAVTTYKRQRG